MAGVEMRSPFLYRKASETEDSTTIPPPSDRLLTTPSTGDRPLTLSVDLVKRLRGRALRQILGDR